MNKNRLPIIVGLFLGLAGIMHFANPSFFNDIVPPWLPPSREFWTYISGIAELATAALLLRPTTRRAGGIAAFLLFIAVYPANLYMTWDWRNEAASQQFISWARLPFQFLFIWAAWSIIQSHSADDRPAAPGDVA
ncbi:MAG: hypothetical protein F2713_07040 [Actinobacteria bacterium]|uniref:Unannotated protein n=1 Tax=freshwater metagenome TaxID=449393 RepID=A0A6J6VLA7_9ZZZZ|nr:hypothetical protein [Actinomycetota bacterium]